MKQYLILSFVFFVMLNLTSCKKNNPIESTNNPTTQIFPLVVGNEWIIQVTNYDTNGTIFSQVMDTIKILRDTTIQTEKWFIGFGIKTNRSDGLYDFQAGTSTEASLIYKYPATVNFGYTYRNTPTTVVGISDTVSVFAGNYVCYHYRQEVTNASYSDLYLAPNVGLVKADFYNPLDGGGVYKYLSYSLIKVVLK
jgi:hypothetical protein